MTDIPQRDRTARILDGYYCTLCSWPVVSVCCNDGMSQQKPYAEWDWWMYCANKTCVNHVGEGFFQGYPDWVKRDAT